MIASIVVYTISLFCPIYFPKDIIADKIISYDYLGYQAVALGWMLFAYVDFFCWLANFTLLISWIFYRKQFANYLVSIGAVFAFLFGINHVTQLNFMQVREYDLTLFGYWFWIIAMLLQIVATKLFQKEKAIMTDEK
ncbi:MAG: hypothetical protein KIG88_04240 [Weeksellaceae bacterium]|nr:hypothetical protein [Weeksellaceae bacterium]